MILIYARSLWEREWRVNGYHPYDAVINKPQSRIFLTTCHKKPIIKA